MIVNLTQIETSLSPQRIDTLAGLPITSLYLHVPFCRAKCRYCDFYSLASLNDADMDRFVDAVLLEASWWQDRLRRQPPITTIFLGGGTPSALPIGSMRRLLSGLREIPMAQDAEWTIEANPATINADYCRMLLDCGVNRLSIGAQSFIDSELEMLGRVHDAEEVGRTVRDAQAAGFGRISLDLIYAVPGQTLDSWQKSLEAALGLGIKHISCYCLTLEESTPMWRQVRSGELPAVTDETQLEYMRFTRQWLREHGLPAYEISNYAAPGEECRHNLVYWESGNYIGLGPAAASHLSGQRWRNTPALGPYLESVLQEQRVPVVDVENLDAAGRATELIMLMLRLTTGLTWARFEEMAGFDGKAALRGCVERLLRLGLVSETASGICLTDGGCYVADEVISELVRQVS